MSNFSAETLYNYYQGNTPNTGKIVSLSRWKVKLILISFKKLFCN
ncbi:hypothetical protein [Spiroplasma poulsonii]